MSFEVLPRHALHAHTLGFIHPTTKKEMYFEVTNAKRYARCGRKLEKLLGKFLKFWYHKTILLKFDF